MNMVLIQFFINIHKAFRFFNSAKKLLIQQFQNMNYIEENQDKSNNKKIIYKVQRLKQAEAVFCCECGKIYLSFPALYLHCRSKHDVKLTTKMSSEVCSIIQQANYQRITYFLNPKSSIEQAQQSQIKLEEQNISRSHNSSIITCKGKYQHEELKKLQKRLNSILEKYFNDEQLCDFQKSSLEKLINYIVAKKKDKLIDQREQIGEQDEINLIPLNINNFVFKQFSEQQIALRRTDLGFTLLRFCQWLYRSRLTEYQLEYSPTWSF